MKSRVCYDRKQTTSAMDAGGDRGAEYTLVVWNSTRLICWSPLPYIHIPSATTWHLIQPEAAFSVFNNTCQIIGLADSSSGYSSDLISIWWGIVQEDHRTAISSFKFMYIILYIPVVAFAGN